MFLDEIREIFAKQDPAGFISQGKDDDIYDRIADSIHKFLDMCNVKLLQSHTLAARIQYLFLAEFFHVMLDFEECENLATIILRRALKAKSREYYDIK